MSISIGEIQITFSQDNHLQLLCITIRFKYYLYIISAINYMTFILCVRIYDLHFHIIYIIKQKL